MIYDFFFHFSYCAVLVGACNFCGGSGHLASCTHHLVCESIKAGQISLFPRYFSEIDLNLMSLLIFHECFCGVKSVLTKRNVFKSVLQPSTVTSLISWLRISIWKLEEVTVGKAVLGKAVLYLYFCN